MRRSLFKNQQFYLSPSLDLEDSKLASKLITRNGGKIVDSPGDEAVYVINEWLSDEFVDAKEYLIVGTPCIVECVRDETPLPNLETRKPLFSTCMAGKTLCCTGIPQRPDREMYQFVVESMAGSFSRDYNQEVTHLLAETTGGAKYQAAVSANIPVVKPEWIKACREARECVDFEKFRLPALAGFRVCVTGFQFVERYKMEQLIKEAGGEFAPDLSGTCTHLLATRPTGKKFEAAKSMQIAVVTPQWLYDSVKSNAAQPEGNYPVSENDDQSNQQDSESSHPQHSEEDLPRNEDDRHSVKPLRRACSDEAEVIQASKKQKLAERSVSVDSLPLRHKKDDKENRDNRDFQPVMPTQADNNADASMSYSPPVAECVFRDLKFLCVGFGFEETEKIKDYIASKEGDCEGSQSMPTPRSAIVADVDYIITNSIPVRMPRIKSSDHFPVLVSIYWLESCVAEEKILPVNHPLFTPLPVHVQLPSDTMRNVLASVTGYVGAPRDAHRKLVRLLGGRYTEQLTKANTHLICKSAEGAKYLSAKSWGTTFIVSPQWLEACVKEGKRVMEDPYLLHSPTEQQKRAIVERIKSRKNISTPSSIVKGSTNNFLAPSFKPNFSTKDVQDYCDPSKQDEPPAKRKRSSSSDDSIDDTNNTSWMRNLQKDFSSNLQFAASRNTGNSNNSNSDDSVSSKISDKTVSNNNGSISSNDSDDIDTFANIPEDQQVLLGVTILVGRKVDPGKQGSLHEIATQLGGDYVWAFESKDGPTSVTHYIHEGKPDMKQPEYAQAKRNENIKIVSPLWLEACKRAHSFVDENDYPSTLNPQLALSAMPRPKKAASTPITPVKPPEKTPNKPPPMKAPVAKDQPTTKDQTPKPPTKSSKTDTPNATAQTNSHTTPILNRHNSLLSTPIPSSNTIPSSLYIPSTEIPLPSTLPPSTVTLPSPIGPPPSHVTSSYVDDSFYDAKEVTVDSEADKSEIQQDDGAPNVTNMLMELTETLKKIKGAKSEGGKPTSATSSNKKQKQQSSSSSNESVRRLNRSVLEAEESTQRSKSRDDSNVSSLYEQSFVTERSSNSMEESESLTQYDSADSQVVTYLNLRLSGSP